MNDFHPLTVQLPPDDRSALFAAAQQHNLSPAALALQLIKDGIAQLQTLNQQAALNALERLDELVSHLPPVDAVELVRTSREELEQRSQLS